MLADITTQGFMNCEAVQDLCLNPDQSVLIWRNIDVATSEVKQQTNALISDIQSENLQSLSRVIALKGELEGDLKNEKEQMAEKEIEETLTSFTNF